MATKRKPESKVYGYDHGVRPIVAAVGNLDFMKAWDQAGYFANAYGVWTHFGVIVNPPYVCMVFEDEEKGRILFEQHFVSWAKDSGDGDAVGLAFIEWNDDSYTMIVYPEIEYLIQRCYPDQTDQSQLDIMAMLLGRGKEFPHRSEHYEAFKIAAQTNAILFMGGTKKGPFEDLIIRKLRVEFFAEDEIPEHSIAAAFKHGRYEEQHVEQRQFRVEPTNCIFSRRVRNLEKYFPVTLERLRSSTTYASALQRLSTMGYQEWQVVQAVCNLVLSRKLLGTAHFQGIEASEGNPNSLPLHQILKNYVETPYMSSLPEHILKPKILRRQMKLDALGLLRSRQIQFPEDVGMVRIQKLLKEHGLLFLSRESESDESGTVGE